MLGGLRQLVLQTVAGAAFYHGVRLRDEIYVRCIGIVEHFALIYDVVVTLVSVPFDRVALLFVIGGQLHEGEVREIMAVHVD